MQRLVLARSVGHGETGFRLRSSVFATPLERGCVQSVVSMMRCMKYEIIISDLYYVFVVVEYLMSYLFHSLKHLRAC